MEPDGGAVRSGVHPDQIGDLVHHEQTPAAELTGRGRAPPGERIAEAAAVLDLAQHLPGPRPDPYRAVAVAVHHAVGGQLGDGQSQIAQALPGEAEPLTGRDREVAGDGQTVRVEGEHGDPGGRGYSLDREEGLNLRTLGELLGSAPSSASRLCDRLQALGFVERAPSPVSRRELELRLTSQGRAYLLELRPRREEALLAAIAAMTPTAREAVLEGLTGFQDTVEEAASGRQREAAEWEPAS